MCSNVIFIFFCRSMGVAVLVFTFFGSLGKEEEKKKLKHSQKPFFIFFYPNFVSRANVVFALVNPILILYKLFIDILHI